MAKNRYRDAGKHRSAAGQLRVLEAVNRKLYRVEIWALNDKVNRNNWQYVNLDAHLNEFKDIPILTAYVNNGKRIGDGHNFDMRRDSEGNEYASFTAADAERIVGWIPADADIRIERKDDTSWIVVQGFLWTWYARELVEKIARQGSENPMDVSIETLVLQEHKENNVDVETEYVVLGITVLGDGVLPAVAGANIQTLTAMREGMKDEILKAASYAGEKSPQANSNNKGVKFMPMTKRQLKELSAKFEGYYAVGASADGMSIALMDEQGGASVYRFADTDNGNVIKERINSAAAEVKFSAGDVEVVASLDDVLAKTNSDSAGVIAERDTYKTLSEKQSAEIASLKERLNAHRIESAKAAMSDELRKFNEASSAERQLSEEILKDLSAKIEKGEFNGLESDDGKWLGGDAVRKEVQCCAAIAYRDMNAEDKKHEKQYISFGGFQKQNSQPTTIGEQLIADGEL